MKSKKNLKTELKYCDIVIWTCFVMMLLVKFFTIFQFVLIKSTTTIATDATALTTAYEANPLFALVVQLGHIGTIVAVIILPASAIAFYYLVRRKVLKGKVDLQTLIFFVQFAFFALLINIVNDGAGLLALLAKGG